MDSPAATWIKRVEIDTRPPFRSVREAVSLFGDRVLLGEVFINPKLEQPYDDDHHENGDNVANMQMVHRPSPTADDITAELEETKQSLEKAKEEGLQMANCISDLKQELERTKQELHLLKTADYSSSSSPSSTEVKHPTEDINDDSDIKFVVKKTDAGADSGSRVDEFQKKRYVTFANPPSLARVTVLETEHEASVLQRHPSLKKKKKKPLIPLIGGIFSRNKKGESDVVSSQYHRLQVTPPRVRK